MEFLLVHRMSQPSLIHLVSTLICDLSQRKNPAACDIKKSALSVKARVRYYINNDSDDYRYAWGFASSLNNVGEPREGSLGTLIISE